MCGEGSRWSCVYYVADGSDQSQGNGECSQGTPSSHLLLIPKHSAKATQWQLTTQVGGARIHQRRSGCAVLDSAYGRTLCYSLRRLLQERKKLRAVPGTACLNPNGQPGSDGVCEYVAVPPTPGTLVVFPGWLLHAVLPATAADASDDCNVDNDNAFNRKSDEDGGDCLRRLPRISVAFNYEPHA